MTPTEPPQLSTKIKEHAGKPNVGKCCNAVLPTFQFPHRGKQLKFKQLSQLKSQTMVSLL